MGSALEIGIKIRKVVVISIRGCYRSVCNHPFLVCFLGFLLLLYRSFPFLFSILVSASPVLICTAVLLGTLLSFGQPNVPEIEKEEEKVTHGISSFQTGFSEGHTVVADRDESYFVKGYSEYRSDIEESGIEEACLAGERDNRDEEDRGLLSDVPLDDENLQDIQPEKSVREELERKFHSFEFGAKREVHEDNLRSEGVSSDEEAIEKQYVLVQKVNDDILDNDIENEKTPVDQVDFSRSSSWKQGENNGDDDEDDDEDSVESGSDQAESSSPDASMADFIPMLDELHPLLDVDAPRPAHLSHDGSDAASEKSQKSDDDSVESDEDTENRGEVEEDGVDERDDEEEEEMEGGKEDESKSAIKWTEDDQRNLMDLGSLELERNQRLENLIARRRARRLITEKNLIDFDSTDLPINVAPIATTRRNPFDFPDESYAAMGLPPIPGSAPSILQPRRNPFDIPYDSNEEKPDLKEDSFQQEFTMVNQKDTFFRRHESFSMGSSVLGMSKHERHDFNWKPVFITERMASEGTSYSSFQRQSSEVSDSKLSSVPDTESVSSFDQDDRKFSEQDLSQVAELISNTDHVSDGVEHGSQSSGENDSVEMVEAEESNVHPDEVEIVLGGVENPSEMEFYPETGEREIHEQFNAGETRLRREPSDEESINSSSSRSSLSEVIDNIPDKTTEKMEILQQGDGHLQESRISTQASVEESNFQQLGDEVEENQQVEPVYDSSPPTAEKLLSFPSVSSASEEVTAIVTEKESEVHDQRLEDNTTGHEETQGASSQLDMEVKNELRSEKSEDINQHIVTGDELSAVAPNFVDQNGSPMAEGLPSDIELVEGVTNSVSVHGQDPSDHISADSEIILQDNVGLPDSNHQIASEMSLSDNESVEERAIPNEVSRFDSANMSELVQDADEMLDSVVSDAHHRSSSDSSTREASVPVVHPNLPSEETEHIGKISPHKEDIFRIEQDKVLLSNSVEQGNPDIHQDSDKNMVSVGYDGQPEIDVESPSSLENHLSNSDKLVVEPSSSDHDESQNSDVVQVDSAQAASTSNDGVAELHDAMDKTHLNISSVTSETSESPEFSSPLHKVDLEVDKHRETESEYQNEALNLDPSKEVYMSQVNEENIKDFDDMKEIDEEFLSELDTVGDFSVGDASVSLYTDIVDEKTGDASLPKDVKIAEVAEVEQDIPVLEARSLEDINLAFKQIQEGVDVKENQLVSEESRDHVEVNSELVSVESKDRVEVNSELVSEESKDQLVSEESKDHVEVNSELISEEFKDHVEVNSELQVVDARSVEDINIAFKQIAEGNQEELPKPLDLKDGTAKVEENEVGSAKMEENEVGSAKVVENFDAVTSADELSRTPVDKSENIPTGGSANEAKSHSRKSSSSSSSSSSDSD